MNRKTSILPWYGWAALIVSGLLILTGGKLPINPSPSPAPAPGPAPGPIVVPADLQPAVTALKEFPKQRAALAAYYAAWSKAVGRSDQLKSTGQFRTAHTNSLKVFTASTDYAGAPAVGTYIDTFLANQLGGKPGDIPDRAIDPQVKATLVAALDTISRSFAQ